MRVFLRWMAVLLLAPLWLPMCLVRVSWMMALGASEATQALLIKD